MEKVYRKWSTVLVLFILLIMPFSASAKIKLQMLTHASPDRVKQFDGNTYANVKDENQGVLDRSLLDPAHPNVTVYATAEYDNANLGSGKTITITYHVDDVQTGAVPTSDAEYYEAPDPISVHDGEITRYSSLTLSLSPEQFISKTKVYDGTDTAVFIAGWPQLLNTVGTYTDIHITSIEAKYTNNNRFVGYNKYTISIVVTIDGADAQYYNSPVVPSITGASITPRQLTVTDVTVADKSYDGTRTAVIANYGILQGIVGSDDVYISTEETTAQYGDKDAGENKQVSIHYILGGTFRGQYIAPLDDNTKKSTISPLPLDVTGTTVAEKYYDGTTSAIIDEEGELNTVLEGDKVNLVVANARYASSDAGSHGVTADFSISGRDAKNYVLRYTPQLNGVINPRQLTVTSPSIEDTKVYDGNTISRILSAGTLGNVVSGDEGNITFEATAEYDDENVGFHKPVNVTYTIYEQNGKHNYIAPSLSQPKYADITAKQLYIVDFEIDSTKVYDKNTTAVVKNNGFLTGVVNKDQGKVTISSIVANYNNSSVGDNKPVYVNFILGGESVGNYKAPEAPANLVADITPKQLTATTPNVQTTKSYDGNTNAKVTVAQRPDGLITPDQLGMRGTASYDNKEVGDNKTITVKYELTGDPAIIKNYIAPVDYQTGNGSITKSTTDTVRSGSISYEKVKTYDGTTSIVMIDSIGELSKKNTGDDVWAVATARYSDSKAETGKTIIIDYRLEGRDKDNYEVPETRYITGEGIIRPKQLSILSAPKAKDKVFDGTRVAELDGDVILNGVIAGDDVAVSATAMFDTAIVGNRQVMFTFSLTGYDKDNYIAPVWQSKGNAKITKRQLHAIAPALTTRKMYDGNTNAEVSVSADMFTNLCAGYEDVILEVVSSKYDDATVGANKRITVTYRIKGNHAGNYSAPSNYTTTDGEIYVNDVLTVEYGSVNFQNKKIYDGTDTIHVNDPGSLVGGYGDVTLVTTVRYGDANVGDGKMVIIEYSLEGPGKDYYATPEPETLYTGVIIAKKLEIVQAPKAVDKVFDGNTVAQLNGAILFSGVETRNGVQDDVNISAIGSFEKPTVDLTKKRKVTISYSLTGDDAFNYSAPNSSTDSAYITPLQLVANVPAITRIKSYNGNRTAAVVPGKLLNDVEGFTNFTFTANGQYDDPNVGTNKRIVVEYFISGNDAVNYIKPVNYSVNNGEITASSDVVVDFESIVFDVEKQYDGTDTIHIINPGNLINTGSDDVNLVTRAHYENENAGDGKIIIIEYELTGEDSGNYDVPKNDTIRNGRITPRSLTLQEDLTPRDKDFNGTDSATLLGSVTLPDVLACDKGKISVRATGKFTDVTAGHGKDVRINFELTGNPVTINNYVAPAEIHDTATIRPKKLKASAPSITKTKVYDGNASAAVSAGMLTNMVSGFENVTLGATATYDNENEGSNKLITVTYTISGKDAINYIAPDDYRVNDGNVTKAKTISVDENTVIFNPVKTYDGTNTIVVPEGGDGQISGLADPDDDVTLKTTVYYEDKNAGEGKMIIIHYELVGDDSDNYDAPKNDTLYNVGKIEPKPILLMQEPSANDKDFDGTNVAPLSTNEPQVDGIVIGDDATVHAEGHFNDAITDATGKQVKVTYYITGGDKDNYIAPDVTYSMSYIRPLKLVAGVPDVVRRKEYDRTNAATVSVSSVLLTNLVEPYTNIDLHAVATYNNEKVATGKQIVVAYSITGEDAVNYIAPDNYEAIYDGEIYKNSSARVEGAEVKTSKEYDGTTSVEIIADGTINNDPSVTVIAHPKYETPDAGYGKVIVITYELEGTGKGYYETPEPDTLYNAVITPKVVHVVGGMANDKCYDGTYDATIDLSNAILNAKVGNDTVTISADAFFSKKNVGRHQVVVTYVLSGSDAANYYLGDSANVILYADIFQKPVSVVGVVANDVRPFNDSTDVEVVYSGYIAGLVAGENVGVVATAMFDNKNVGIRNVIYHFDFTGDTTNYFITNIDSVDNAGGEIIPVKPYVVGTVIDSTKVYDGTRNVWVRDAGALYGFGMDGVFLSASATYSDENVANAIPVYVTYSIAGPNAYNFEAPDGITLQANITPKKLSVTGTNVNPSKGYDKLDTISIIYPGDLVGVCAPDSNNVGFNVHAHYDDVNVGTAKSVSVHYSLTGGKSGNYIVTDTALTADITRRQLYATGTIVDTVKQYDGSDYANVQTSGVLLGVAADDEVFVNAVALYGSVTAGDNKIINVVYSIVGDDATNYIKPQDSVITIEGSILKRQLFVSDLTLDTTKVYDGNTTANVSVNGVVPVFNNDIVSVSAYANYTDKNVGNNPIAIHYLLSGDTANYIVPEDITTNGSITCKPVSIVGTKVDSTKVYDGTSDINIISEGSSPDFIAGDSVAVAANALLVGETYGVITEVAVSYYLVGADNGNYCITNENDTLQQNVVISPKLIDIVFVKSAIDSVKVYDATTDVNAVLTLDPSCIVGNDDVQLNILAYYDSKNVGARVITIHYMLSGDDYYKYQSPKSTTCSGAIIPAPLNISDPIIDEWKMYDGNSVANVLGKANPLNIYAGDQVYVLTNAMYNDSLPGSGKTIRAYFSTYGTDALNYIVPDSMLYSTNGIIFDTIALTEQANGMKFIADAVSYCKDDKVIIGYNVLSGDPVEYRMEFLGEAKSLFADSAWTPLTGDNTISFPIDPRDDIHGVYQGIVTMRNAIQQRDDIISGLHSDTFEIRVNMSADAYLTKMFSDVISLVLTHDGDTFSTYQWYKNGDLIPGATLPYYKEDGGLDGVYYCVVNMGTPSEERTCDSPLFVRGENNDKRIMAYPNPVQDHVTLKIENFEDGAHTLNVVNAMGNTVQTEEFTGDVLDFNMDGYVPGVYTMTVDDMQIKVIKK